VLRATFLSFKDCEPELIAAEEQKDLEDEPCSFYEKIEVDGLLADVENKTKEILNLLDSELQSFNIDGLQQEDHTGGSQDLTVVATQIREIYERMGYLSSKIEECTRRAEEDSGSGLLFLGVLGGVLSVINFFSIRKLKGGQEKWRR
jgi:hypothetical protein